MFAELGITAGMDRATKPDPAMRIVTAGHAVQAMVLNGLGFLHQQRSLVPPFFHNTPLARLLAPGMQASHRNDDTRGRPLETLYLTFRTLFRTFEAILEEPPAERGAGATYRLLHAL